jgi:hypothetical protein
MPYDFSGSGEHDLSFHGENKKLHRSRFQPLVHTSDLIDAIDPKKPPHFKAVYGMANAEP